MKTVVVNLRQEPYDVYIGRPGKGQDGYFGNPYVAGKTCKRCGELHSTPMSTLRCFKAYFEDRITHDFTYRIRVYNLKGKILGCFCSQPGPCHGNVIAHFLDNVLDCEEAKL